MIRTSELDEEPNPKVQRHFELDSFALPDSRLGKVRNLQTCRARSGMIPDPLAREYKSLQALVG